MATATKLSGPVGQKPRPSKGKEPKNAPADVKLVQDLLNAGGIKCPTSGKADKKTIEAIEKFQKTKAKLKKPDGVVDPDMKTFKALLKHGGSKMEEAGGGDDKAKEAGPKPKKISISYMVPVMAQPTNMSCWATAIAMMLGWKKKMSFNPETIADELGYTKQFKSGGLHPEDTKVFKHWGLKWEAPMCYTVQGFADILKANGPLWIAGNPKAPHVRVVTGMSGDGTPEGTKISINDPAGGKKYKKTYVQVAGKMENLGASEAKLKAPIYLAHF